MTNAPYNDVQSTLVLRRLLNVRNPRYSPSSGVNPQSVGRNGEGDLRET